MNDDKLNERETAPIVGVKVKTLQNWRQLRRGPAFLKVGSRVFYRRADLDRYLDSCVVETNLQERPR